MAHGASNIGDTTNGKLENRDLGGRVDDFAAEVWRKLCKHSRTDF